MEYSLRHHGIVTGISSRTLSVSIASGADCAGCAVKSVCHPSGKPQDEIIVKAAIPRSERTRNFNIGDKVEISISTSKRMKAIFLALALPCLLLVCGTFTAIWLGTSQTMAATAGIAATAIYYFILYICRDSFFSNPHWVVSG
ncbi:SoxR reducing system RseC family protein [Muribaculum sp.]|uniref:SoxR reducing system RseC family protein n=1 Tax=Muribaculum sp. TaxID=1918611 RepID=UPI0023C50F23|nr:SoxR reducing system RseC family protein [Muribaculum sp.]MDE5704803.1 SoxR reducing system RseC family protein [Muribaculum sp.]